MNKVIHFEIPASNMKRADGFYEKVFGWRIDKTAMPGGEYHLVTTCPTDEDNMPKDKGTINGALMEKDGIVKAPVLTIQIPDIKAHVKKIEKNGGKILMDVQGIGNMGLYVRFSDTEGNIMALWQNLPGNLN